jgi:ketosteroid isomerase-like protein
MGRADAIRRGIEDWNRGDIDGALQLAHPEIEMREASELPGAVTTHGIEELRRYMERFRAHWARYELIPEQVEENGDRALLTARLCLLGRKSRAQVERRWFYVYEFDEDLCKRQTGYAHEEEARKAAGL